MRGLVYNSEHKDNSNNCPQPQAHYDSQIRFLRQTHHVHVVTEVLERR